MAARWHFCVIWLYLLVLLACLKANCHVKAVENVCIGPDGTSGPCDDETEELLEATHDEVEDDYDDEEDNDVPPMDTTGADVNLDLGEDFGVSQQMDATRTEEMQQLILQTRKYIQEVIYGERKYRRLREECKNKHESCTFWAAIGECQANPAYMNVSCGPACQSCEYLLLETRCPLDPNATDAWYPGDIQRMFERMTTEPQFKQYEPNVLSRPDLLPGDQEATAPYKLGPWVVTMENVVTAEEALRLIELGALEGYERSADVGELKFDGTFDNFVNEGRTSTNAWCQHECYDDDAAKSVMQRIVNITNVPELNQEYLQLLRYEVGQFYQTHHDYIHHQRQRQEGVRVLTVYLYLNDVEEGGGTNFPRLDLTVMPKRGRALIWPSVLNEDPNVQDPRTDHQALPVLKGIKYGANAWIHQRDFKTPNANGCS